ncbi:MAG: ABC transporter ATP-binding protein [Pseudomonadota bacterium]
MKNEWLKLLKQALKAELPEDSIPKGKSYGKLKESLAYIFPSVFKYWKLGAIAYTLLFINSMLAFPMPLISRYLIDDVIMKKQLVLLLPVLGLMASIMIITQTSSKLNMFYNTRFDQKVMLDLQTKLLQRILSLPKSFFDKIQQGYLMSRLTGDLGSIKWFFSSTVVQIFVHIIKFFGGVGFLVYLEWRIAVPVILFLPISVFVTRFFAKRTYIMSHRNSERHARYQGVFQELLSSIPLIKAFASEQRSITKICDEIKQNNRLANEQLMLNSLSGTLQTFVPKLAEYFVLGFGAYWVITDHWTLGSLIAFRSYLGYVYGPVNFLSSSINQYQSAKAALNRTVALFETIPEPNTEVGLKIDKLEGDLEFKDVSFSYDPPKTILNNISIKINKGENWAIIGESGVGKTTFISLIMQLYRPTKGHIIFDNKNVLEYNVRSLRNRIGYVAQSTTLLTGSVTENLRYGNLEASMSEIIKAAKIAGIHEFIESLPEKYETKIQEKGKNLSEGQKQRISLARALVKNPDILILDEPTSALDNITEKSIYNSLPNAVRYKTTLTIAHRVSTIKDSDQIIMLRKGKTPLIGKHSYLIENESDYIEFFNDNGN